MSSGALFLMPYRTVGQAGPVAVWITAAGWAAAARDEFGVAWLVTPEGTLSPEEARALATQAALKPTVKSWRRVVPASVRTALKDVRRFFDAKRFRRAVLSGPWVGSHVAFVWQCHELFHTAGPQAARKLDCPCILFVDAPVVWQARKGGVHRRGWGRLLELVGEDPILKAADVVACVSEQVANEVCSRGVDPQRVIVTPSGERNRVNSTFVSGR
jgi:hypothetical protein